MSYLDSVSLKLNVCVGVIAAAVTAVPASLPFFEVSYATVGMAVAGSLLAFAYSPPVVSRKRMYGYAIGGIFIGVWGLKLLQWKGVDISLEFEPVFAGTIALISQQLIPPIVEAVPTILEKLSKFGRKNHED